MAREGMGSGWLVSARAARAAGVVVGIVAAIGALAYPVTPADHFILDRQFIALRSLGPSPTLARVAVIGIDRRSTVAIRNPLTLWHEPLAELLLALRAAPPRLVAFDLVLPDRTYAHLSPGLDEALMRGLLLTRSVFPTVLAFSVDENRITRQVHPPFIAAAGTRPGYALWPVEADGFIRRFDEHLGERGQRIDTLAGEIARQSGVEPRAGFVDFAIGAPFEYVSFIDVIEAGRRDDRAQLAKWFGGKIVMVGVILQFVDVVQMTVELAGWGPGAQETPGVLLQAQAVRSLLGGRILAPVARWVPAGLAAAAALLALVPKRATTGG